jgi:hypothetical protein
MCPWNGSAVRSILKEEISMNVDIYATSKRSTFIAVRSGITPPAEATRLFKCVELETGKPRICLDPDLVMRAIAANGFAVIT